MNLGHEHYMKCVLLVMCNTANGPQDTSTIYKLLFVYLFIYMYTSWQSLCS